MFMAWLGMAGQGKARIINNERGKKRKMEHKKEAN